MRSGREDGEAEHDQWEKNNKDGPAAILVNLPAAKGGRGNNVSSESIVGIRHIWDSL